MTSTYTYKRNGNPVATVLAFDEMQADKKAGYEIRAALKVPADKTLTKWDMVDDPKGIWTLEVDGKVVRTFEVRCWFKTTVNQSARYVIKADGPITPKQESLLRKFGHDVPQGATKIWASTVISDILAG